MLENYQYKVVLGLGWYSLYLRLNKWIETSFRIQNILTAEYIFHQLMILHELSENTVHKIRCTYLKCEDWTLRRYIEIRINSVTKALFSEFLRCAKINKTRFLFILIFKVVFPFNVHNFIFALFRLSIRILTLCIKQWCTKVLKLNNNVGDCVDIYALGEENYFRTK